MASRLISVHYFGQLKRLRGVAAVDFFQYLSNYLYYFPGGGVVVKVPINEKRYITITEAEEYFSIGRKALRVFAAEHPELACVSHKRPCFRYALSGTGTRQAGK
jgi:hypothetical protein